MVKGLSILVVGGQEDICNILDKFFSDVGHTVMTTNNGAEAIKLAESEDFDLVLCDLLMSDVAGYAIKALNDLDKVPKIGMITDRDVNLTSAEKNALRKII